MSQLSAASRGGAPRRENKGSTGGDEGQSGGWVSDKPKSKGGQRARSMVSEQNTLLLKGAVHRRKRRRSVGEAPVEWGLRHLLPECTAPAVTCAWTGPRREQPAESPLLNTRRHHEKTPDVFQPSQNLRSAT